VTVRREFNHRHRSIQRRYHRLFMLQLLMARSDVARDLDHFVHFAALIAHRKIGRAEPEALMLLVKTLKNAVHRFAGGQRLPEGVIVGRLAVSRAAENPVMLSLNFMQLIAGDL